MHVHMRVKQVSAHVARRGSFRCEHCTHWQRGEVLGFGVGTVTLLRGNEGARERAQANAARDGDRLLRFATCPKCGKRGGKRAFAGRYALICAALCALMFLLGLLWPVFDHSLDAGERHVMRTWIPLFVDAAVLLIVPLVAYREWRGIDGRVRWLEF